MQLGKSDIYIQIYWHCITNASEKALCSLLVANMRSVYIEPICLQLVLASVVVSFRC